VTTKTHSVRLFFLAIFPTENLLFFTLFLIHPNTNCTFLDQPGVTREVYWEVADIMDGFIESVYKDPRFPTKPSRRDVLYNYDSTTIRADDFAQRIYGWFLPPLTGGYIFYTSCDDACDLFMSPNENPMTKLKLISQREWSEHNQFDKYVY